MGRNFSTNDGFTPQILIQYGLDHLHSAKLLFQSNDIRHLDSAGYLAHLGIEVLLKAFVLSERGSFPATHDIERLYNIAHQENNSFKINDMYLNILKQFDDNFGLRYPTPDKKNTVSEGQWSVVSDLVKQIKSNFPPHLKNVNDSFESRSKGGRRIIRKRSDLFND